MNNKIFDTQFDDISSLTWYPWVGKNYTNTPLKTLVIDESLYAIDGQNGNYDKDTDIAFREDKNTIRALTENAVNGGDAAKFYKNLSTFLSGNTMDNKELYSNIAFYNFIQRPAKQVRGDIKTEDFKSAWFTWLEVVKVLRPDVCIFCGISMQKQFPEFNIALDKTPDWEDITETDFSHMGKRIYPIQGTFKVSDDYTVKLLFVQHPSSMYQPLEWRNLLEGYIKNIR